MIPYGRQWVDELDISAVTAVLRSDWLTQGPVIERFERALGEYVGVEHAVAFSSGTAALHGAAWAAGLGAGDVVVTSPLSFIASANCARYVGAKPSLIDIEVETWNLNLSQISTAVAAVVAVHYGGLPVDLSRPGWPKRPRVIIEDAAHALGAWTSSGPVGNCAHSDMTCFSFHPVKPITCGEGGMVTTNSRELADRLRGFRTHSIARLPELGGWYYEISEIGFNYRLTDIQAALGLSQLAKLDQFVESRNAIAARYRRMLSGMRVRLPPSAPDGWRHGYHLFPVMVPDRRRVFDSLRSAGIGVQVHYVPIHHHPVSSDLDVTPSDLPITEEVYAGLLSLPIYPGLSESHQDFVVEMLGAALE